MDPSRFDRLAVRLAGRPRSRRAALAAGGAGLGAALLGLAGKRPPSLAQDASPVASPAAADAQRTYFLFVQTFAAGTLTPKAGEPGTFELTLSGGPDQTVYFSDRPQRIVGSVATARFLDGLGFTPDNPPNAALVAQTETGEDVVVLELIDPRLTESFGPGGTVTLTYDVRILADYQGEGLNHLALRQGDAALPGTLGAASVFIDDCPDDTRCGILADGLYWSGRGPIPGGPYGRCWDWASFNCTLCSIEQWRLNQYCNDTYPDCGGKCLTNGAI